MLEGNELMIEHMRAIQIDPEHRNVEVIDVEPANVAGVLRSSLIETIDFEQGHCLVIDDGSRTTDHPTRFRLASGPVGRPFFGTVLILGIEHGNWIPATMEAKAVSKRIIWEEWDQGEQRYALPALGEK